MVTRREFLDTVAVGAAGLAIGSTAKSYSQIMGSNERLNFAVMTDAHFANFIAGIRKGEKLNAAGFSRQRGCDDAAAFEHRMVRAPRTGFGPL